MVERRGAYRFDAARTSCGSLSMRTPSAPVLHTLKATEAMLKVDEEAKSDAVEPAPVVAEVLPERSGLLFRVFG